MPVLIEHPDHGRMHVYSPQELQRHILLGWSEVKEPEPKPKLKPEQNKE